MTMADFEDPEFVGNVSVVGFLDGTGTADDDEVSGALLSALPGVASRFRNDDVYVGKALCGFGDERDGDERDGDEPGARRRMDCSRLGVSFLPDVRVYGA